MTLNQRRDVALLQAAMPERQLEGLTQKESLALAVHRAITERDDKGLLKLFF